MKRFFAGLFIIIPLSVQAQLNHLSGIWGSHHAKAEQLYRQKLYEEAIVFYEKEMERYDITEELVARIADCYHKIGNYEKADDYYTLLFAINKDQKDSSKILSYAKVLTSTGRYEMAIGQYQNYLNYVPEDYLVQQQLALLLDITPLFKDSMRYIIASHPVNTAKSELGVTPSGEGFYFSSGREEDLIIRHDHLRESDALLDLYYFSEADSSISHIKLPHHFKSNDGPVSIWDDDLAVFTRNNGYDKYLDRNSLGLYVMKRNGGNWHVNKKFPYNDGNYNLMHPSLSPAGDTLYFASDMPGGFGGYDIYYSLYRNGNWSQPVNLGASVNSQGNETFPYAAGDAFYFSSNGHPGLGAHDIFKRTSGEPQNLGYPINTGYDDFGFSMQDNAGYFTSNREGTLGHDDIYTFTYSPPEVIPPAIVSIQVVDSLNGRPLSDPQVLVLNESEERPVLQQAYKGLGNWEFLVERKNYRFNVEHAGYESTIIFANVENDKHVVRVPLMPDISLASMNLDSILFSYDDHTLTKNAEEEMLHIVDLMSTYQNLNLEISAHTDSRGEDDYNHDLSQKRANSTAEYLISHGIDSLRITTHGYGEEFLLNECDDNVPCSEEEHMVNRRIEFILKIED